MNDIQILTIVLATVPPTVMALIAILVHNSRLNDMNGRIDSLGHRIGDFRSHLDDRFNGVNQRFDDTRDMWRSELHRVEEILDARLKHIEQR